MEASTTVWAYSTDTEPLVGLLSDAAGEIAAMLHQQGVLLVVIALQERMYWVRRELSAQRNRGGSLIALRDGAARY